MTEKLGRGALDITVVSLENEPRTLADGISVLPWRAFLDQLWDGEIISPELPRALLVTNRRKTPD